MDLEDDSRINLGIIGDGWEFLFRIREGEGLQILMVSMLKKMVKPLKAKVCEILLRES